MSVAAGPPLASQHAQAAQVRAQHFRNHHAAVSLLVVLQHSDQGAAHGQAGAVQGVQQFVLALRILESGLQAAGLEGFAIAASSTWQW